MTEVETNGHERREDDPRCVKCGKAWPCEGWLLDPPRLRPTPIPASPARDARIDAYRDRERRRAARALDRYIESLQSGETPVSAAAGERVVELVGDYVLSRLQQKSDYGATDEPHVCACPPALCYRNEARALDIPCRADTQQNADSGVVTCPVNGGRCGLCARGGRCLHDGEPGTPLEQDQDAGTA